jgi:hypothetical protein
MTDRSSAGIEAITSHVRAATGGPARGRAPDLRDFAHFGAL